MEVEAAKQLYRKTKEKAIWLHHYYPYAITQDVNRDVDSMRTRMWATLFHCMSTDDYPTTPDALKVNTPGASTSGRLPRTRSCLPTMTTSSTPLLMRSLTLVPVYLHMSDPILLKKLLKGKPKTSTSAFNGVS